MLNSIVSLFYVLGRLLWCLCCIMNSFGVCIYGIYVCVSQEASLLKPFSFILCIFRSFSTGLCCALIRTQKHKWIFIFRPHFFHRFFTTLSLVRFFHFYCNWCALTACDTLRHPQTLKILTNKMKKKKEVSIFFFCFLLSLAAPTSSSSTSTVLVVIA